MKAIKANHIRITFERTNGTYKCPASVDERSIENAVESLLIYEIGYGGSVIDITPTKVVVRTYVMACVDVTQYEGAEKDMEPLVAIAIAAARLQKEPLSDSVIDQVMQFTGGKPLIVMLGAGLITGMSRVRQIMLEAAGVPVENIQQWADLKTSNKEIGTALSWVMKGEASLSEAYEMLGGTTKEEKVAA